MRLIFCKQFKYGVRGELGVGGRKRLNEEEKGGGGQFDKGKKSETVFREKHSVWDPMLELTHT
jgi:hypothetical protein